MPLITVRLAAGRSDQELGGLIRAVSEAASRSLEISIERVGVHIFELEPNRIGRGGEVASSNDRPQGPEQHVAT